MHTNNVIPSLSKILQVLNWSFSSFDILGSNTTSTTATTNHSATDAGTVTPDVNTGTSDSLAATHPQSSTTPSEDGGTNSDYIYYILTGVVCAVCAVCMILVVVACVYICRQYRVHNLTSTLCTRRTPAKASGSSERRPSEAV